MDGPNDKTTRKVTFSLAANNFVVMSFYSCDPFTVVTNVIQMIWILPVYWPKDSLLFKKTLCDL